MNHKCFQDRLATGSLPLLVASLVAVAYWWLVPSGAPLAVSGTCWEALATCIPGYVWRIGGFVLYVSGVLALAGVTVHHALIRVYSTFYLSLFVVFSAVALPHTLHAGSVLVCCLLAMFFFLFHTYQRVEPVEIVFQGFFAYGIATLFFPPAIWYLPFLLIMQSWFHRVTVRVLFAMLVGAMLPYWFLFAYAYTADDMDFFVTLLRDAVAFMPIDYTVLAPMQIAGLGVAVLLTGWSCVLYAASSYHDKIRTRTFIYYVMAVAVFSLVFLLLQPQYYAVLMSPVVLCCSLLAGHYLAVTRDRRSLVTSVVLLVVMTALYVFNLWIQLYSSF